jgi:hypothetical protein
VVSCDNTCCLRHLRDKSERELMPLEVYDVLRFRDTATSCDGRSDQVQSKLLWHYQLFTQVCAQVHARLRTAWRFDELELTVAFTCRRGKHRSVACAALIHGCLLDLGVDASLTHMSIERHNHGCRCRGCNVVGASTETIRLATGMFMDS